MLKQVKAEMAAAACAAGLGALTAMAAYGRWPYDYYEIFRWIICGASVYVGYTLRSRPLALVVCAAVAVIFNPIAPMRMHAYQWKHYDIVAAIAMALMALYALRLSASVNPTALPGPKT